jgi:hypothetical protein
MKIILNSGDGMIEVPNRIAVLFNTLVLVLQGRFLALGIPRRGFAISGLIAAIIILAIIVVGGVIIYIIIAGSGGPTTTTPPYP